MRNAAADLPREAGAYVLLIRLERRLPLDIPAFRGKSLPPGRYAYCGSAYGPGGIRARVSRHLCSGKPQRWHVDRLTSAGSVTHIVARVGAGECSLADEILAQGGYVPLPGFGSSDCNLCPAHLLGIPRVFAAERLGPLIRL